MISEVIEAIKRTPWPQKAIKMAVRGNMHIHVRAIEIPDFKYGSNLNYEIITIAHESIRPLPSCSMHCLEHSQTDHGKTISPTRQLL